MGSPGPAEPAPTWGTFWASASASAHAHDLVMSSTKSMTGHTLGAAGGVESIITALAVQNGVAPPTINLDHPDTDFDLNFAAHTAQERPLKVALNNSFGFGGHNVSLAFRRYDGD